MYLIGSRQGESLVCFQETHSTKDVAVKWEDEWGSKCFFSHGDSKSAGVSAMFRNGFDSILDQNGHYIIFNLTVYEQHLTLVCLYGYNTDKPELFTDILQKSAGFANTSFLFCGDSAECSTE